MIPSLWEVFRNKQTARKVYFGSQRFVYETVTHLNRELPLTSTQWLLSNPRILHDYKCIYIHIPKTGGTSLTATMEKLPREPLADNIRLIEYKEAKHAKAVEVRRAVGEQMWGDYFSFALVRNPWDLMVSCYHWWLQKAPQHQWLDHHRKNIIALGSFSAFLDSVYGRQMINEYQGDLFDWIADGDDVIVDHVGKLETVEKDWGIIAQRLGLQDVPLQHLNKTKRKNYQDYYDARSRQLVAKRFQRTIEQFKYSF